jgi:hypothetical protein
MRACLRASIATRARCTASSASLMTVRIPTSTPLSPSGSERTVKLEARTPRPKGANHFRSDGRRRRLAKRSLPWFDRARYSPVLLPQFRAVDCRTYLLRICRFLRIADDASLHASRVSRYGARLVRHVSPRVSSRRLVFAAENFFRSSPPDMLAPATTKEMTQHDAFDARPDPRSLARRIRL